MARVELKNVCKTYQGGVHAVKDANFVVEDEEFIVLVGPSGCGKSTTLRMIAGLEDISSGEIHIDGRIVNDVAPKDRDIAMVFQNYALYPHMTVYKNMAFGLMLRRFPKPEIDQRVREAARILGIEHLLDRKPKALSGGERQRVAVCRALINDPLLLLADEPTGNLDRKTAEDVGSLLLEIAAERRTMLICVTHSTELAARFPRRLHLLDGRLVAG